MTATSGTRLGPYEILALIGAGGMGEVYKARDTRLDRSVAIKILPAEFAQNTQFKTRFEREARTISQLNHPHICTLFDVGDGYLVMELLEGESLADRVGRGPMPVNEILKYGAQIAEALGKAHREGVVHRDLKPGNIMITKAGAKLLDFGLAKGIAPLSPAGEGSPTLHKPLTQEGTIVGTFQYMAPEQLAGEEPDARTDIFAFGCVLYEMATGKRAFEGKNKTSLIAAIVTGEPPPMTQFQPLTPNALEHVVKKCLAKDPDDRWQSAADIAEELRWIGEVGSQAGVAAPLTIRRKRRETTAWIVAAIAAAVASISMWRLAQTKTSTPVLRLTVPLPAGTIVDPSGQPVIAISPDGTLIVYAAVDRGTPRLWIRHADRFDAQPLGGTEGAVCPFFSPDGEWIGFVGDGVMKKVATSGGAPLNICQIGNFRGATWGRDGNIYFVPDTAAGLWKVPDSGGKAVVVTRPDSARDENSERWPQILPDGKHVLITTKTPQITSFDAARIAVVSLTDGSVQTLLEGGTYGRYLPSGHLIFARGSSLYSVPFDLKRMRVSGAPAPVLDGVYVNSGTGGAYFDFADNGSLVYIPKGAPQNNALIWIDRQGHSTPVSTGERQLYQPRVSPDGRTVAVRINAANDDIGLFEIERATLTRLSFDPGNKGSPIWTPDGLRVIYQAELPRGQGGRIMWKSADGSGTSEELLRADEQLFPSSVSPDGKLLAYIERTRTTGTDICFLSLKDRKRTVVLQTPFNETAPMFSPDGRWLAYQSNESGRDEVYIRSLAPGGGRWQVSTDGGVVPRWSRDGRELFYWNANHFYGARIVATPEMSVTRPQQLAATEQRSAATLTYAWQYDVAPDGRFVIPQANESFPVPQLNFVTNWFEDVRRRTPARR